MPISDIDARALYAKVQGNILKGHGRENAAFLFIDFGNGPGQAPARAWIADLLTGSNEQPQLTSTAQQLTETAHFKKTGESGAPFASLMLSSEGYAWFNEDVPTAPSQAAAPFGSARTVEAFAGGMRTEETRALLDDPAFEEWERPWFQEDGTPTLIHALLLLADDSLATLGGIVQAVQARLASFGATVRVEERGNVLKKDLGSGVPEGIEHFGYADGVSQPIYLSDDMQPATDSPLDTLLKAEELVLVAEPRTGSFGSFFVFRKLAQDVDNFKNEEEKIATGILQQQATAGHFPFKNDVGAMMVGRVEAGTPAVLLDPDELPPLVHPINNKFDYSEDTEGLKCPFHAHIRKVNPRTGADDEVLHRLTRRGIPYGQPAEKKVGLLFMAYQRNINQQFEFIQKTWADNASFPQGGIGLDPIIGQGSRSDVSVAFTWGQEPKGTTPFRQFVTLLGGEYFYVPSLLALEALAGAV